MTEKTTVRQISVQRFSVTSVKSFENVIAALEGAVSHPDMNALRKAIGSTENFAELETFIQGALGPSGWMEFMRFNMGEIIGKDRGEDAQKSIRFLIGNPLIMKQMAEHVPDAASYAPVTVLVDERRGGVQLSYDRMASFLAPYENEKALKVAQDLDSKIEKLLAAAAV